MQKSPHDIETKEAILEFRGAILQSRGLTLSGAILLHRTRQSNRYTQSRYAHMLYVLVSIWLFSAQLCLVSRTVFLQGVPFKKNYYFDHMLERTFLSQNQEFTFITLHYKEYTFKQNLSFDLKSLLLSGTPCRLTLKTLLS